MSVRFRAGVVLVSVITVLAMAGCSGSDESSTQASTDGSGHSCGDAISWTQAAGQVGERATVQGPVMGANYAASTSGQPTFLDIGKAYPAPDRFTVLIWGSDRGKFDDAPETAYTNKTICVQGLIESYKGAAEIVVTSPDAIVVSE